MPQKIPIGIRVVAKPAGSEDPIFRCSTSLWTVALKTADFKREKGFANLSLGLNYTTPCMASSQPQSRYNVPLGRFMKKSKTLNLKV
jgi:hypothetical protein